MKTKKMMLTTLVASAFVSAAQANLTVNDIWGPQPGGGGEWNLYNTGQGSGQGNGIMEYLYGTGFTYLGDVSQWVGTTDGATMDAVYAGADQSLYTTAPGGGGVQTVIPAFSHTSGAPSRNGTFTSFSPTPQPFLFEDLANGNTASSDAALSTGGVVRMVAFLVTGYNSDPGHADNQWVNLATPDYVIAFEDGSDFDFNDLVVEVKGVTPVPEPTTVVAGAMMLLPLGVSALRILRRKCAA